MKTPQLLIVLIALVLAGCSGNSSRAKVIPEETFVNYYADLLVLNEEGKASQWDSTLIVHKTDSLRGVYHIQADEVQQTINEYHKDLSEWQKFFSKVVQRLENMQREQTTQPKL